MASYPTSVKTWTDRTDGVDEVLAADINTAYAEITAIETQLITAISNYSDSIVGGLSSIDIKQIFVKKIGKMVFVSFYIAGTSNDSSFSFTLPYTSVALPSPLFFVVAGKDNGSWLTTISSGNLNGSASQAVLYKDISGATWTASGEKAVIGQFFYEAT